MKKQTMMQLGLMVFGVALLAYGHAGSPGLTTWSSGQVLTHTALNDTVAHMHNTFSGGITNSHISTSASIEQSKIQNSLVFPRAIGYVASACGASPCTVLASHNITTITRTGAGVYPVTLSYTPTDTSYGVMATAATNGVTCSTVGRATAAPHYSIVCFNVAGGAATDSGFSTVVLDNN